MARRRCTRCWRMRMLAVCVESLEQALPGANVEVAVQQSRIHLTGVVDSDAASDEAARLAAIYSKDVVNSLVVDPRHLPQVRVAGAHCRDRSLEADGVRHQLVQPGEEFGRDHDRPVQPAQLSERRTARTPPSSAISEPVLFQLRSRFGHHHSRSADQRYAADSGRAERSRRFMARPRASWPAGSFPYPIVQPGGAGNGADGHRAIPALRREAGVHAFREFRRNHSSEGRARGQRAGLHQRGRHRRLRAARAVDPARPRPKWS